MKAVQKEKTVPAKSAKQYGLMQAIAHGSSDSLRGKGPNKETAKDFIGKTSESKRKKFAHALKSKK